MHEQTSRPDLPVKASAYRQACQFKFDVARYPEEFDLELVRMHGWYSPSNRLDNLAGVSRDHLLSVADGYRLGVPASLMRHPANCQLLLHAANKAKAHKSTLSLDELRERVVEWELKYAARA